MSRLPICLKDITTLQGIDDEIEKILQSKQEKKTFKDAGKRVGGSRKEKAAFKALLKVSDLENLEKDEITAQELVKKDKVYPKVDWKQEMDKGTSAGAAYLLVEFRKAMATKPKKLSRDAREFYVVFINHLVSKLELIQSVKDLKALSNEIKSYTDEQVKEYFFPNTEIKYRRSLSLIAKDLLGASFTYLFFRYFRNSKAAYEKWKQAERFEPITEEQEKDFAEKWQKNRDRDIEILTTRIRKFRQYSLQELRAEKRSWRYVPKDLKQFREVAIKYLIGKLEKAENKEFPKELKKRDNDWSWTGKKARAKTERKNDLTINSGLPLNHIKRTGGLAITNVSEKEIIRLFGFKYVEFGNYVKDEEAEQHIRHFLGACSDLFEVLNFNPIQTNQMNDLSISFGSRGRGKALATYNRGRKIINLTKKRGDGTVAHEWAHFFDNLVFHKQYATQAMSGIKEYATMYSNVKHTSIQTALNALMKYIEKGEENNFMVTRFFKPQSKYTYYALKKANSPEEALSILKDRYPRLFILGTYRNHEAEMKNQFGYIAHKFGIPALKVELLETRYSQYYAYSSMQGKYWIEPYELFARAFETYVFEKLNKLNRSNNYLVSGAYFDHPAKVYPIGKEREKIFGLFESFISAVKKELSIKDFVPFTDQRTDEYIEFDSKAENEKVKTGIIVKQENLSNIIQLDIQLFKISA